MGLLTVGLLDISGVPGTGKTATVHAVVRELKRMAENGVRHGSFTNECRLTCAGNDPIHVRRD